MKICVILFCLFTLIPYPAVLAQTADEIKNDESYLWGDGYGESINEADKAALANLTSRISISVYNEFNSKERDITINSNLTSETEYNNVINTYSNATLTNTQRLVVSPGPEVVILRFIKKSEIDRIFASREQKVKAMIQDADLAESKLQIDNALRYFYWASALLQSLRYPNEVRCTDSKGNEQLATTYITYRMNEILNNISIKVHDNSDPANLQLLFTYNKERVNSLDYTYFDGRDMSCIMSAQDGIGLAELPPGNILTTLQVNVEYGYNDQTHIDQEIKSVVQIVKERNFPKSCKIIPLNQNDREEQIPEKEPDTTILAGSDSNITNALVELATDSERCISYNQKIGKVLDAIASKQYQPVNDLFTSDAFSRFEGLVRYGSARLLGRPALQFVTLGEYTYCHSVPMSFSFSNNTRKFVEDVVFTFDSDGNICNVSFGLGDKATEDIVSQDMWSKEARVVLTDFLENYKTAYALKNIDYLNAVFSDEALIITGKVLHEKVMVNDQYKMNKKVVLSRKSKTEYITNLRQVFNSNEYINLRFTDNTIEKAGKGEIYGINLRQDYYSSNYADSGYLLLIVDVNNPKEPIIHVRVWQDQKAVLDSADIITFRDF